MCKWILDNRLSEEEKSNLTKAIDDTGNSYVLVDRENISLSEDDFKNPVVVYGGILFAQKLQEKHKGVWATWEDFYCHKYYSKIKNLLNKDGIFITAKELDEMFDDFIKLNCGVMHIRPNAPDKPFTGFVARGIEQWNRRRIHMNDDDYVIVSPFKKIQIEWRFFVNNDGIVAHSSYRKNGEECFTARVDTKARETVMSAIQELDMHDPIYVIDVVKCHNIYSVVEINSFSASGMYKCNIKSLVKCASKKAENNATVCVERS